VVEPRALGKLWSERVVALVKLLGAMLVHLGDETIMLPHTVVGCKHVRGILNITSEHLSVKRVSLVARQVSY
jgi:hypothetical protein